MKKKILLVLALSFLFISKVYAEEYSADFQVMAKDFVNGKVILNADEPESPYLDPEAAKVTAQSQGFVQADNMPGVYARETVMQIFTSKYNNKNLYYYGWIDYFDSSLGHLCVENHLNNSYECHEVSVEYTGVNQDTKAKVKEISKNIKHGSYSEYDKYYYITDLGFVNYILHGYSPKNFSMSVNNKMINYSEDFQKDIDNYNISVIQDSRAGDFGAFYMSAFGMLTVVQNGMAYDFIDGVRTETEHIIYIPTNTEKTREAYISAAQKRIDDYVKGTKFEGKIEIKNGGLIADMEGDPAYDLYKVDWTTGPEWYLLSDSEKNSYGSETDFYILTYNGTDYCILIEADSDKMTTPSKTTIDLDTEIEVSTTSSEVPLDSEINSEIIKEDSDEYKNNINILGLKNAFIMNISLYSNQISSNISNISSDDFNVFFNIPASLKGKKLYAYYIGSDGNVEKREVIIDGNRGLFKTNHFSTYTIGTEENESNTSDSNNLINPKTGDSIYIYLLSFVSLSGLLFIMKKIKIKTP